MMDCCRSELKTRGAADRHLQNYTRLVLKVFLKLHVTKVCKKNLLHRAKGVFQYISQKMTNFRSSLEFEVLPRICSCSATCNEIGHF